MMIKEDARVLGMPKIVNVTNAAQTITVNSDFVLRNTGADDLYFLVDQSVTVTTSNGFKVAYGDVFPLVINGKSVQLISPSSTTAEVVVL
jgi:hypothetical protein